jgi:hypothetical protein
MISEENIYVGLLVAAILLAISIRLGMALYSLLGRA